MTVRQGIRGANHGSQCPLTGRDSERPHGANLQGEAPHPTPSDRPRGPIRAWGSWGRRFMSGRHDPRSGQRLFHRVVRWPLDRLTQFDRRIYRHFAASRVQERVVRKRWPSMTWPCCPGRTWTSGATSVPVASFAWIPHDAVPAIRDAVRDPMLSPPAAAVFRSGSGNASRRSLVSPASGLSLLPARA